MGIGVFVFEEDAAPARGDLPAWISAQLADESKAERPGLGMPSKALNFWFTEMRETFPTLSDADPGDLRGTDYSFRKHFVYMEFAGPIGEEGIIAAWSLAEKYGLRILVGDELLPRSAPKGERKIHISVLDGRKSPSQSDGTRNTNIAVVDPAFVSAYGMRQWVLDQLALKEGRNTLQPTLPSESLRQWSDEFIALDLNGVQILCFEKFILLRFPATDFDRINKAALELATRLHLGLLAFDDL